MSRRHNRKNRHADEANHERWVISYADFITLLFAFFVVMYSISSVNDGKYRVLSDSLVASFNNPQGGITLIEGSSSASANKVIAIKSADNSVLKKQNDHRSEQMELEKNIEEIIEINEIAGQIEREFVQEIDDEDITIKSNDEWIEVEIKSSLLFPSGVAQLNRNAGPVINRVAGILMTYDNPVKVEGFTDNVPINTPQFSSNWALSSARAVLVVQLLVKGGIDPERLAAIGYGEFQPVADNNLLVGRKNNRRVVLVISKGQHIRPQIDEEDIDKEEALPGERKFNSIENILGQPVVFSAERARQQTSLNLVVPHCSGCI